MNNHHSTPEDAAQTPQKRARGECLYTFCTRTVCGTAEVCVVHKCAMVGCIYKRGPFEPLCFEHRPKEPQRNNLDIEAEAETRIWVVMVNAGVDRDAAIDALAYGRGISVNAIEYAKFKKSASSPVTATGISRTYAHPVE